MKKIRIIVDLDSLFDTRLGCVKLLYPDSLFPLIQNGYSKRYHNKLSLLCDAIDDDKINGLFEIRDIPILKASGKTQIVDMLSKRILEDKYINARNPTARDLDIIINTYPYSIDRGLMKILVEELRLVLNTNNISRINLPVKDLTPEFLKTSYNRLITHNVDQWMLIHSESLLNEPIPYFSIIGPGLIHDIDGLLNEMRKNGIATDEASLYRYIYGLLNKVRQDMSPLIEIEYLAASDFSISFPKINHSE